MLKGQKKNEESKESTNQEKIFRSYQWELKKVTEFDSGCLCVERKESMEMKKLIIQDDWPPKEDPGEWVSSQYGELPLSSLAIATIPSFFPLPLLLFLQRTALFTCTSSIEALSAYLWLYSLIPS